VTAKSTLQSSASQTVIELPCRFSATVIELPCQFSATLHLMTPGSSSAKWRRTGNLHTTDINSLYQKSSPRSVVGARRNLVPWIRRAVRTATFGLAPAGYKTRNLGRSYKGRRYTRFYNLCSVVMTAISVHVCPVRRVIRVDLDTIGPLYHDPGCSRSRWAGVAGLDDLDLADLPDTPSQGAVMGPGVIRPPFITAGWPAACFARHQPRAGPLPRNPWGRVSVIGFSPTLLASPSGVVGNQPASRASHCPLTDRSVHSAEELKILLLDCRSLDLGHCVTMSLEQGNNTDASGSSSGGWDGLASPDVLRKYREPKWYMERGAQTDAGGTPVRIEAWGYPIGLPAAKRPRRHKALVRTRAGFIVPVGVACATMSACLTHARHSTTTPPGSTGITTR